MEQETKTEGIESNTGETNAKRSRRRQTQRNVLHLISTSARDAGKVSQASAPTSTHTSHQHLSLSMKIEKNIFTSRCCLTKATCDNRTSPSLTSQ